MQKTRNWQDSFDRLEASRRDEQRMREAEERQIRLAEAAYAQASLEVARAEKPGRVETSGFLLADEQLDQAEVLVEPKPPAKSRSAKLRAGNSTVAKASPRKRAAPRRTARGAKPRGAKPKAAGAKVAKPRAAAPKLPESLNPGSLSSPPPSEPASAALLPAISLPREAPQVAAEPLLITPLQRSASLARYRKPGLFGLIGSWLRLAARRPKLPEGLRRPVRTTGSPRDDVAALREENKQLRSELEALRASQANTPPWLTTPAGSTTPAGDVPARPRRRGEILP